ncbi:MAG: cyclic nucleotide-binding domain-containing protein [Deltaproteobacteria bacterium]|nr:cyclic nucleotide-binding domain-containing protein [Deltaproteobacteria bacterium]
MTDSSTQENAIEAIIIFNAALTNIRLYPPTSDMISNSIDSANSIFQSIIEKDDSVVFAEAEGNLVISGQVLNEADKKRPQMIAFVNLMLSLSIKSISLEKGLDKSEILAFLEVMSKKPDDLEKEGGIQEAMTKKNIRHIHIDKKLFVAIDKNQQVIASKGTKDPEAEQYHENTAADDESVRPSDPDRRSGDDRRVDDGIDYLANGGAEKRKEEQRGKQLLRVQNGINSILKGEDKAFMDTLVMRSLPPTVLRMISQGKQKNAEAIIDQLGKGLLSEKEKVRAHVSIVMAHISIKLISDKHMDDMNRIFPMLTEWIKFETIVTPAYKHICNQFKGVAQSLILNYQLAESNQILEPFYLIYSGKIKKADEIKTISGDTLKGAASEKALELLLNEFQTDDKNLGEHVIDALAILGSISIGPLLDILNKLPESKSHGTMKEKIQTQEKICIVLGRIGSREAVPALKSIVERKDLLNVEIHNKGVQTAAKAALEMITKEHDDVEEKDLSEKAETKPPPEKKAAEAEKIEPAGDELSQQLKLVDQHVEKKDTESAVKLLFDMIVKYARQKDFEKAETLRDKLLDVGPMALTEIVKSAEIIEEMKSGAIDQDHLNTWRELFDKLTEEETNTLYFAMKSASYDADQTVFQQGKSNSRLYFIYKGQIKLVTNQDDENIIIKELGAGDIMGEDTFLSLTVCTTTAVTLSEVELFFLEKEILAKWEKDSPGIESKLSDYCSGLEKVSDILKKQGWNRRAQERVKVSCKVLMHTIDDSGSPIGQPVRGTLADISIGGLSFDSLRSSIIFTIILFI